MLESVEARGNWTGRRDGSRVKFGATLPPLEAGGAAGLAGELAEWGRLADPFRRGGQVVRCPGDTAGMLPGDEVRAIEMATEVRQVVLAMLGTA